MRMVDFDAYGGFHVSLSGGLLLLLVGQIWDILLSASITMPDADVQVQAASLPACP